MEFFIERFTNFFSNQFTSAFNTESATPVVPPTDFFLLDDYSQFYMINYYPNPTVLDDFSQFYMINGEL